MLFQKRPIDERMRNTSRLVAAIGLGITQVLLAGVCLAIYGIPEAAQWHSTWLPTLLGPALMVGAYAGLARLGQWNVDRQIGAD